MQNLYIGKVRDRFECNDKVVLITTDRMSGFDRQLCTVPFKGQVLNLTSAWWFKQTEHIVPNHVLAIPDANVTIGRKCTPFPIEFVMRGYITGSTSTSLWTNYQNGVRKYCGIDLPEGLKKNQKLWENLITPTTKSDEHDELIAITKELTDLLRKNRTIDWYKRESARAAMRMMIKRLLKKHRYPPEGMEDAVQTVMSQCELWTDNADITAPSHKAHPATEYKMDNGYGNLMAAEKTAENSN